MVIKISEESSSVFRVAVNRIIVKESSSWTSLKMEAACSIEMFVHISRHWHHCENLKPFKGNSTWKHKLQKYPKLETLPLMSIRSSLSFEAVTFVCITSTYMVKHKNSGFDGVVCHIHQSIASSFWFMVWLLVTCEKQDQTYLVCL